MGLKKFAGTLCLCAVAGGAAWYCAQKDLLGASPRWIESRAEYPPLPSDVRALEIVEARDRNVPEDLRDALPSPEEPGATGPDEPAGEGGNGAPADGTEIPAAAGEAAPEEPFPADLGGRGGPLGLDRFLRESLVPYTVRPGDTLSGIGQKFRVPYLLIANMNGIEGDRVCAGDVLKVVEGPFHVLVLRQERTLRVFCGRVFVESFGVAVGKPGSETGLGEFRVRTKMREPAWTDPDTNEVHPFGDAGNPLGTRWIGFTKGIGIHGTWEEESIGRAASRGCVRMRNGDVEVLFDLLVRRDSVVRIVERLVPEAEEEAESPEKEVQPGAVPADEEHEGNPGVR